MMSSSHTLYGWTGAAGWQSVTLPYVGNTLSAVALLPPVGTKDCSLPSAATLDTLLGPKQGDAAVRLPKLHLEQTHDSLIETLVPLGLPAQGDFSRSIGVLPEQGRAEGRHGRRRGRHQGGRRDRGVMATSGMLPSRTVAFDRPFLFLIRDTATGSPLFLSWIGDPTQP